MYSPFYSLASESSISPNVPEGCQVTFAQALYRHGARYPTSSKNKFYSALTNIIQANATTFEGEYAFLKTYNYSFGSDDLTPYGEHQLYDAGIAFYNRYEAFTRNNLPFIRASDADRVVGSAQQFISGFQTTKESDRFVNKYQSAPTIGVIISEDDGMNNTLNADTCTNFETSETGDDALATFANAFVPSILKRVQSNLPGVTLNVNDVVYLMDLCSFDTVFRIHDGSELSPFCNLFTQQEWVQYNYYNTLNKYYGYGGGNYLGPANGIGFVNELIARMTHSPVHDDTTTTTNSTLDLNSASFPLNAKLYADFSHDNGLTPIFFALGLYNSTKPLSNTTVESTQQTAGYSTGWSVPYGARSYIEMMTCCNEPSPLVRV